MPQPDTHPSARPVWGPDAATATALVVTVGVVWLAAKLLSVWAWVVQPGEYGDTYYYFMTAESVTGSGGVAAALREYPTPAGLLLLVPYELGATDYASYRGAIMAMMSLADAAFAALLGRRLGPVAVLAWVAVTFSLGSLSLLRFDMLPAVVAGAAVLAAMERRGAVAAALVGLGTGLKVWPIVLFPLVLGRNDRRRGLIVAGVLAGVGVVLVVWSLAIGGWDRLLSPLDYQGDRGLQIESVAATVPMIAWAGDEAYRVWYSTFHAYELVGPSVATWLRVASVASVLGALGCAALYAWWWLRGANPAATGWLACAFVGTFMVTSRALSPQYLLWLAAPAVVVLGMALLGRPGTPALPPALLTFAAIVGLCVLTTAVYPVFYGGVTGRTPLTDRALVLLAARNLGLVVFVAWSVVCAAVTSARPSRPAG